MGEEQKKRFDDPVRFLRHALSDFPQGCTTNRTNQFAEDNKFPPVGLDQRPQHGARCVLD
ncbi:MAG: hypothetical protein ABI680_17945 [Chthoniobacteraceae bacterium]